MALRSKSLFLFGYEVAENNRYIDFKKVSLGVELTAVLTVGFYSLSGLITEIKRAMQAADTTNVYSVSADRTVDGGLGNRVTISTSGSFLSILFGTGSHSTSNPASLIGFPATDQTGSTTYTGTSSSGTTLLTQRVGYSYMSPDQNRKVFGSVNVSASGVKEAIVFAVQKFITVTFKHEPFTQIVNWATLFEWMIRQKPFDFTPEVHAPTVVYDVTLESTGADGQGLAYQFQEMIPEHPFQYTTGALKMRVRQVV